MSFQLFHYINQRSIYETQASSNPQSRHFRICILRKQRSGFFIINSPLVGIQDYIAYCFGLGEYIYPSFDEGYFHIRFIRISPYIENSSQHLYIQISGMYNKRFMLILLHLKISFTGQVNISILILHKRGVILQNRARVQIDH